MIKVKISVRNLIETVLRTGDIDDTYRSINRMLEGTLAHQKVQKSYGEDYKSEVSLKTQVDYQNFSLEIEGRADVIYRSREDLYIEEIKSSNLDLDRIEEDFNELHWAQVKFYAYIYSSQENLDEISLKLTYFQLESEETKSFYRTYSHKDLRDYFYSIIDRYVDWANLTFYWIDTRKRSIDQLGFPFKDYRQGQREMAVAVYRTIEEGKKIYIQAPTGIGKTMSTIFPALKTLSEGFSEKIFYLTAKTITRQSPLKAYEILRAEGLRLKTLVITSKEKICLNEEVKCNPRDCKYAKGHFDRVNGGIQDIFKEEDLFSREIILDYARKHNICPFEFSLDLANFSDLIICDYNYLFDPQVMLKRFFDSNKTDYVFLVDEVHNLVDRARSMYSAQIIDRELVEVLDEFKEQGPIFRALNKLINIMDSLWEKLKVETEYYQEDYLDELFNPLKRLLSQLDKYLVESKDSQGYDQVLELYFNLLNYIRISDYYDEHFYTSFESNKDGHVIKLNCIDPSYLIRKSLNKGRASIMFSATLSPMDYYRDLLGGNGRDYHMILQSPFPRENLQVLIASNISTKYRHRQYSYLKIVEYIEAFVGARKGNYLIFFPSYNYMERVYDIFLERNRDIDSILQERNMTELEREEFLNEFNGKNIVGFAVMGGIFSEGIDLVGDRLIGAVIVGVGMPMISFENNMIKDYYDQYFSSGFDYSYTYPGMNKVLQAAGRVIRREEDRGVILLIDTRYASYKYRDLFPKSWNNYSFIRTGSELNTLVTNFWKVGTYEGT